MSYFGIQRMAQVLWGALFLFLLSGTSLGKELRWTHFGLRPLAMGNAYVAVADDFNALFYNPAGLARLKEWDGEFFNPYGEISKKSLDEFSKIRTMVAGSKGNIEAVLNLLEDNSGTNHHAAFGLTPHLVFPGFGFGIGAQLGVTTAFHRDISVDLDFGPKILMPVSIAGNFLEDRLSLGASVKLAIEGGVDHEFSIVDISAFSKSNSDSGETKSSPKLQDYIKGGAGVGFDVGLLFTPIKTMSPTLGVSVTDLGATSFSKEISILGKSLGRPNPRLPSVNTGISFVPWEAGGMYVRTSMDAHAINQPQHFSKKFNLGAELGLGSLLKIQTGLHQGELSGGFEFDLMILSVRFVTYAEQIGVHAGEDDKLTDRRYAAQIKMLL